MAKTRFNVITIFDGDMEAKDAFISLILEKLRVSKTGEILAKSIQVDYTEGEVPMTKSLASGLCG